MRRRTTLAVVAMGAASIVLALSVSTVLSTAFTALPWSGVGSSGNASSSDSYRLGSTSGQSPIGVTSNSSHELCAGFWCGAVLDSDGDGLPDGYEAAHACLDSSVADADADPDGDGRTNQEEFKLGSKPCVFNAVGGIAELPEVAGTPLETDGSSRANAGIAVAVAAGAGAATLAGAGFYARRRWLR